MRDDLDERERELAHRRRDARRGAAEVGASTPSLVDVASAMTTASTAVDDAPHDQPHDVARVAEVPLAGRPRVGRAARSAASRRTELPAPRSGHVVPSRATAATTRSSSTVPASRPK